MADSQHPYPYTPEDVGAIRTSLSEPRFGAYFTKGGEDIDYALALYLYNARLAKAFLFPLHVVEVSLRNAVDGMLVKRFGVRWHEEGTVRSALSPQAVANLEKAVLRSGDRSTRGQVVSELTFDFWSNLFRSEYHDLWRTALNVVFPNAPRGTGRSDVGGLVRAINVVRNRVAHHEPVLDLNVPDVQAKMHDLIGLRCGRTAAWVRHHSTIGAVLRTRPRGGAANSDVLSARMSPGFVTVELATPLMEVIEALDRRRPVAVCIAADGLPTAAFSALDLTRFIAEDARANAGLFAAEERVVQDLLRTVDVRDRWKAMPDDGALSEAIGYLKGPRIDVLVGTDRATGRPTGTIQRAHRRY